MELAKLVAPEIDRLVLGVNGAAEAEFGRWLLETAQKAGLAEPGPAGHYADFLLAGSLTADIARRRSPYRPEGVVDRWLTDLTDRDLIVADGDELAATPRLEHLLEGILEVRTDIATALWSAHESAADIAAMGASMVIDEVTEDFVVAAAHAVLPEPADRYLLLHSRLTTLRYLRQHAHVEAWKRRNLDAAQAVALTTLWHGEDVDPDDPALAGLVELGFVDGKHIALTADGQMFRRMIEDDTNALAQPAFDVLGDEMGEEFATALRTLPSR